MITQLRHLFDGFQLSGALGIAGLALTLSLPNPEGLSPEAWRALGH